MTDQNPNPADENRPQPFDITVTIPKVLSAIDDGTITAEEALQLEEARGDDARPTLLEELKKRTRPVNNPKDPAPSSAPSVQIANPLSSDEAMEAKGYSKATIQITKRVRDNTYGLGAYFDPEQKATFGKEPVEGWVTPFVNGLIRNQELEVVS